MSAGCAVRLCAIEQPMLTIMATMRCAMKPGLSRHTVTGTPSEARSPCAASAVRGIGDRGAHDRAPLGHREQRVHGNGARRIEPLLHRARGRVLADGRDEAERFRLGLRARFERGAELREQRRSSAPCPCGSAAAYPDARRARCRRRAPRAARWASSRRRSRRSPASSCGRARRPRSGSA